jgi:hydrogenase-4 component F
MISGVILIPIVFGIVVFVIPWQNVRRWLLLTAAALHLAVVISLFLRPAGPMLGGWLALDALGLLFLSIVSLLFFISSVYAVSYLSKTAAEHEQSRRDPERVFIACLLFFLATMSLVTVAHHLGLLWVAIEATTLASAPLIFFHRTVHSLEATWKYLLICSVGIALALFGTFFLAAASAAGEGGFPLTLDQLIRKGSLLDVRLLRIAFIFLLVGYGTKMGLAPMHTWLPDAHSEAPSVVSSLLSGVLLNCAFLGILRSYQICAAAGQAAFAQNILLIFGMLSMLLAAVFILNQPDYKRMLAYSSVEHMGILALGIGLGPVAFFYALFHALNHSLTKGMLFLSAGNILAVYKTKTSSAISGLIKHLPMTGALWILGFLAITGTPLFGLFVSEFNILGAAVGQERYVVAVLFLFLLSAVFIGMGARMLPMAQGRPKDPGSKSGENFWMWAAPMILLIMTIILGIHIPEWLHRLLTVSAANLGGAQ